MKTVLSVFLVFLSANVAFAGGTRRDSSLRKVQVTVHYETSQHQWSFVAGKKTPQDQEAIESLNLHGFSVQWDESRDLLRVSAHPPMRKVGRKKVNSFSFSTLLPVELEGESLYPLTVKSPQTSIVYSWTNPSLTIKTHPEWKPRDTAFRVLSTGVLQTKQLNLISASCLNQGHILSPEPLELTLSSSVCENFGKIESQEKLTFLESRDQKKSSRWVNLGSLVAPQIEVGRFFEPFSSFQNGRDSSAYRASIQTKNFFADFIFFKNSGNILASEKVSASGRTLENDRGMFHAGGVLFADLFDFKNTQGSISGNLKTQLKIRQRFGNRKGEVGSGAPTELELLSTEPTKALGRLLGTSLELRLSHSSPVTLRSGELLGSKAISIVSDVPVSLPQVQLKAPLLNLSAPDFALDPQTHLANTVIHCDPKRDFNLTSPFCSQGQITFLQSDLKADFQARDGSALGQLRENPTVFLNQRISQLAQDVKDGELHFQADGEEFSRFQVVLKANLKTPEPVQVIAPLAHLYFGDEDRSMDLQADSLRVWSNFLFQIAGTVSVNQAMVHAPGGVKVGTLTEEFTPEFCVRRGKRLTPILLRSRATWATKKDFEIQGPLSCDGTIQVGGDLVIHSEKPQWSFSPWIEVQGNLVFDGSGPFHVVRHVGEAQHLGPNPWRRSTYSVPGAIHVQKALISEKPMVMSLYATDLVADEVQGDLSVKTMDTMTPENIEMPGEQPKNDFRSSLSTRKGVVVRLEGRNNQGIISGPNLFLIENKGEFYLAAKNPYYLHPKAPLKNLMQKAIEMQTVYWTQDLKEVMDRAEDYRFHFSLRERFFFNHAENEAFYRRIQDHVVTVDPIHGWRPLPKEQVVFSYSPQLLLKKVQEACREDLLRNYFNEDQPISLETLVELHENTTEYLKGLGFSFENSEASSSSQTNWLAAFSQTQPILNQPKKPLIFYQRMINSQDIEELTPFLYIPPHLSEQVRARQTGNVFAELIARFPKGTSTEEMLQMLPEGTEVRKALSQFLEKNPKTRRAVNQAARQALLMEAASKDVPEDRLNLKFPIRSPNFALVTAGTQEIQSNQGGQSGVFGSLQGDVKIESEKQRKVHGSGFQDEISDQRTLNFSGGFAAVAPKGKVQTRAVKIKGDLVHLAGRSVQDLPLILESSSHYKSGSREASSKQSKAQVSEMTAQGGLEMEAQETLVLQGTQATAARIDLGGQNIAVLGVENRSESSVSTEEKTGWWIFSGEKKETHSSSETQFQAASLQAKGDGTPGSGVISMRAQNDAVLQAPEIAADQTRVEAEKLSITQGVESVSESSTKSHENSFWISQEHKEESHRTYTGMKLTGDMDLQVKKLEIQKVKGQVLEFLDKIHYDPEQVEVIEDLLEEFHHRDEKSISAPGPALVVAVTIASSLATAGVGGAIVGSSGTALAAAASAALSSVSAQVATQLTLGVLAQQSPGDILGKILSPETLKSAATAALSAGALNQFGGTPDATQSVDYGCKIKSAGIQSGVGLGTNMALEGQDLGSALKGAGLQFLSQAAGSCMAGQIGAEFKDKKEILDRCLHKVAHGAAAAGVAAFHAALTGQDVGLAVAGGVSGAVTSEIVADLLSPSFSQDYVEEVKKQEKEKHRPLTQEERNTISQSKIADITRIAKISGAVSGLLTGSASGMRSAAASSSNATDHNWALTVVPFLIEAAEAALLAETAANATLVVGSVAGVYLTASQMMGQDEYVGDTGKPIPQDPSLTATGNTQYIPEDLGDSSTQLIPEWVEASSSTHTPAHQPLPFGHHSTTLPMDQGVEPLGGVFSEGSQDSAGVSKAPEVGQRRKNWLPDGKTELGPKGGSLERRDPKTGELIQKRYYDTAGKPLKDIDYGHDHGAGNPHAHDWHHESLEAPNPSRGDGRPIDPQAPIPENLK
ncbi:MAG: hypothetical protein ACO3A2_10460 [Bdellovibrionia bacterium]